MARLLLNFDRASQSWWQDQNPGSPFVGSNRLQTDPALAAKQTADFQRLQASISLGLRAFQSNDGVQQLFELLRARFGGTEAGDRQVALLFSLMGDQQPTASIARLVAETDKAYVNYITVDDGGSGYERTKPPLVSITAGAASGIGGAAQGTAILKPTGQLLSLDVVDGGSRYNTPPNVWIAPPVALGGRRATARLVLGRGGEVEAVVVTDYGEGYSTADEPVRQTKIALGPTQSGAAGAASSLTCSHLLSPPLTSSHLLSPLLTSSHLLSPPLTSSHLLAS